MHQQQIAFENIVGKEEIAHDKQFLLFPQCFQLNQITVSPFVHIFDTISLFAVEMEEPNCGRSGKGLKKYNASKLSLSIVVWLCEDSKENAFGLLFSRGLV